MAYDNYDLFADTDSHLIRPKFSAERANHFYPSEASVKTHDEYGCEVIHGGCLRASYFRCIGGFEGTPHNARTEFIFMQGKAVEEMLISQWKEMGIWVANNVKFLDAENNISGELDAILVEPQSSQVYGVEVKSFYGYQAEAEIFGNKGRKGFPKMNQLLQTLIYCNHFKDRLPFFRMAYFDRGSVRRRTFKVELHQEGDTFYPKVEGDVIRQFSMKDILARYKQLAQCIKTKTIPQNDFELQYSAAKIEDLNGKGKVAKTKYEKWKKGKLGFGQYIGDWECAYCRYSNTCWGASGLLEDSSES